MGRDITYPKDYTKEVQQNLAVLLEKINVVRAKYGKPMTVSSGFRPASLNANVPGAAKKSKHIVGLAVDIVDKDGKLWEWVLQNLQLMQDLGLYLEDKRHTKSWVHFQIGPPLSGKRIYKPTTAPYVDASLFNGKYDPKYDKA